MSDTEKSAVKQQFPLCRKLLLSHHYSILKSPFNGGATKYDTKKKFFTYQTISRKYEVSSTGFPEKGNNLYFYVGE